ncbi:MAG: DUF1016 domain-containing protein [bacterium]|nr:DUF1016 domain-containing protein [bacterium]
MLREELSWTHYKSLIRVENPKARKWYCIASVGIGNIISKVEIWMN